MPPVTSPRPVVTLYGRSNCGLCDEAETMLRALGTQLGFTLELTNIESDPALLDRFLLAIPVVAVDGREIARAPIRRNSLEAALRAALAPAR